MRSATLDKENKQWVQTVSVQEYYTVQECSIILDVGSPSVYSAIKRGSVKGVRINGVTHVSHNALIEYIDRRGGGRQSIDITEAVIEEINPEKDAERRAVDMVDAVESETSEPEESEPEKKSPLDFLDE